MRICAGWWPELDDRVFTAFNERHLDRFLTFFSEDLEPVPGYGAIQIARHEFCHWEAGAQDCGVFGFTHLWRRQGDRWQITRVFSYGH